MGRPRQQLHDLLLTVTPKVYFQPPEKLKLEYPCIVYHRNDANTQFADNSPYSYTQRYQVTVIDRNPDSTLIGSVAALPMCLYNRGFRVEELNHDVFNIYF